MAIRTPDFLAPIAGVALVLAGLKRPSLLVAPLRLAGSASSGIGLFVAGLRLAAMPALFVAIAALLGAKQGIVEQGLLLSGPPRRPMAMLLATRHKKYEVEASGAFALSSLAFIATPPITLAMIGADPT